MNFVLIVEMIFELGIQKLGGFCVWGYQNFLVFGGRKGERGKLTQLSIF